MLEQRSVVSLAQLIQCNVMHTAMAHPGGNHAVADDVPADLLREKLNTLDDLGNTICGHKIRNRGNHVAIRNAEPVEGNQPQIGRTVDDDVIVIGFDAADGVFQNISGIIVVKRSVGGGDAILQVHHIETGWEQVELGHLFDVSNAALDDCPDIDGRTAG